LACAAEVDVGVVEAGHYEGVVEVAEFGLRACELFDFGVGADGEDFVSGEGYGGDDLGFGFFEALAREYGAVVED